MDDAKLISGDSRPLQTVITWHYSLAQGCVLIPWQVVSNLLESVYCTQLDISQTGEENYFNDDRNATGKYICHVLILVWI